MDGLIDLFISWDGSSYVIMGLIIAGYVAKKFFSVKLGKYNNFINIAISDLVSLYDKQSDKMTNDGKHTAVSNTVYKALPKYVKVFISQDKLDSKIKKAVDNLRDKEELVVITANKVVELVPQEVETNQLSDILKQVKKDVSITPIVNVNMDDYKKSMFGVKIRKLF